jgi:hypothetical protein
VDALLTAGIKPPEVYYLAQQLLPDYLPDRPLTPEILADLLASKAALAKKGIHTEVAL